MIVVDEGQDFDSDMGLTVRLFLKNESCSELYVFYDINQNIFEQKFENAFMIQYPPFVLRYNVRNTGSIYKCAVEKSGLGVETVANSLIGVKPEFRNYKNKLQAINGISGLINHLTQKEFVSPNSIVILSDTAYENSILANEERIGTFNISLEAFQETSSKQICFKTIEQFKG